jgi:cellobiose phosphorylase
MRTVGIDRYKAEPYAWVSNIVGPENARYGWANVTQVTGTATWMDVAATQYLLGVRPEVAGLRVDPCLSADWPSVSVVRRWRGCELRIDVDNAAGVEKGVAEMAVDGEAVDLAAGPVVRREAVSGKRAAEVKVRLG